jgi:signal transduction histidine kinase
MVWNSLLPTDASQWVAEDIRPFRYWGIMGSLWYRVMATPVPVIALTFDIPASDSAPVLALAAVLVSLYVWLLVRIKPPWLRDYRRARLVLLADTVLVAAANLAVAAWVEAPMSQVYWVVLWPLVQGSVMLWLSVSGLRAAFAMVGAALPLFVVMLEVNGAGLPQDRFQHVLEHTLWLLLALAAGQAANVFLRSRAAAALIEGIDEGRAAERMRSLRLMHDTALQALDAVALIAAEEQLSEEDRRRLILRSSREEARQLRTILQQTHQRRPVSQEVAALVAAERTRGLPVRAERVGDGRVTVPSAVQAACCDALREALTNARRHAQASDVAVRTELAEGVLRIDVIDDGVGFDPDQANWGFGLSESIVGRLAEVGARAVLTSAPGAGTTVTLRAAWGRRAGTGPSGTGPSGTAESRTGRGGPGPAGAVRPVVDLTQGADATL